MPRANFTIPQILTWADAHHLATGRWPTASSRGIPGALGETWRIVDRCLRLGERGLPGGSSLAKLLAEHRGKRNIHGLPDLTEEQILAWADDHCQRKGIYPTAKSGIIPGTARETWQSVDAALQVGGRGLAGGSSLARLLAQHRGVRNRKALPPLTEEGIFTWAKAEYDRTGKWSTAKSGPIADAPGETWLAVDMALRHGGRRLPGKSSLAQLIADRQGLTRTRDRPVLTIEQILAWADAWHGRKGEWPTIDSGTIPEAPGETWKAVDRALRHGRRGLPGNSSLARLLAQHRGVRKAGCLPKLTVKKILAWADAHRRRTGKWPTEDSGPILDAPGETWSGVNGALRDGLRGLRGGTTLAKVLAKYRGKRHHLALPPLAKKLR